MKKTVIIGLIIAAMAVCSIAFGTTYYRSMLLPTGTRHEDAGLKLVTSKDVTGVTAAATITMDVDVPIGCVLIGCQIRVDSALAAGETWDAAWSAGGGSQSIASAQAVAQNTKVNKFFDPNANSPITTGTTDITITKNGGGSFTAQGTFTAIAYYLDYRDMEDE